MSELPTREWLDKYYTHTPQERADATMGVLDAYADGILMTADEWRDRLENADD